MGCSPQELHKLRTRWNISSVGNHIQAQDFARLAFHDDFKRTAADFAIRREPLRRHAGVYDGLETLTAERALDVFGHLHDGNIHAAGRT